MTLIGTLFKKTLSWDQRVLLPSNEYVQISLRTTGYRTFLVLLKLLSFCSLAYTEALRVTFFIHRVTNKSLSPRVGIFLLTDVVVSGVPNRNMLLSFKYNSKSICTLGTKHLPVLNTAMWGLMIKVWYALPSKRLVSAFKPVFPLQLLGLGSSLLPALVGVKRLSA